MSKAGAIRSIAINGRFLSQPITGVQRYALEILSALDHLLNTGAVDRFPATVFAPPNARDWPAWASIEVKRVGSRTGHLWEQSDLPRFAKGALLFTPCGGAPVIHADHVITIHDAGPFATPHAYTVAYRNFYKLQQRFLARNARHILTVSGFSRHELMRYLNVPPERISYAWLSGEHALRWTPDPSILDAHRLRPGQYLLAVASKNPNKNLATLVQAMAHCQETSFPLALAGGSSSSVFGDAGAYSGPVVELGFVTDRQLRSLYENAACFIFPSVYEGFGLPPLEALTLGCPVIAARAASLPEIFGDAVTWCDPHSAEDIARQIALVLAGQHPSKETALRHAAGFTWQACARSVWSILLNAL